MSREPPLQPTPKPTKSVFTSSTREVPEVPVTPRHLAIIMDGNGRWARARHLPRVAGHRKGVEAVRASVRGAIERGIEYLTRLTLTVAANYGGRWDVAQAARAYFAENPGALLSSAALDPDAIAPYLAMSYAPEPDLFIRTGGEQRISNFLLWQLAYTELYFTEVLWPDFGSATLDAAIASYRMRERRFGRTSEQLRAASLARAAQGE